MANPKGNPQNLSATGNGRPKGAKNKFTLLKENFLKAFEHNGGWEELAKWGKKPQNQGQFYMMLTKLFPKEVALDLEGKIEGGVVILPPKRRSSKMKGGKKK